MGINPVGIIRRNKRGEEGERGKELVLGGEREKSDI